MWLIALFIILAISTLPVVVGAHVVGARRKGFLACLVALLISYLITGFAFGLLHGLGFLALFASGLGYMLVLDTTYWRGLGIAFIHAVLMIVLFLALAATLFHGVGDLMRHLPSQVNGAVQSV